MGGFYSEPTTFETSVSSIKVLTSNLEDHKLEIPENCEIKPPRLGTDFQFELQLRNNQGLISKEVDETDWADIDWAEERVDIAVNSISKDYTETEELSVHFRQKIIRNCLYRDRLHTSCAGSRPVLPEEVVCGPARWRSGRTGKEETTAQ